MPMTRPSSYILANLIYVLAYSSSDLMNPLNFMQFEKWLTALASVGSATEKASPYASLRRETDATFLVGRSSGEWLGRIHSLRCRIRWNHREPPLPMRVRLRHCKLTEFHLSRRSFRKRLIYSSPSIDSPTRNEILCVHKSSRSEENLWMRQYFLSFVKKKI